MVHQGKTVVKTFRIDQKTLEALHDEARKQQISLNTFVYQVLTNYCEFERYHRQMRSVMFTHETFTEILKELSEDQVREAGRRTGKSVPEALIISKHGKMTVNGVIDLIRSEAAATDQFAYSEIIENEHWTITLTHEFGRKWSVWLASCFYEAFFVAGVKVHYTVSDHSTTFSL